MSVDDCQAIARGETELVVDTPTNDRGDTVIAMRRDILGRDGIVVLVNSLGIARTGKTTIAMELAAICSSRGVRVALVDADSVGTAIFNATVPNSEGYTGLLSWEPGLDLKAPRKGSWILPGTARSRSVPVDVWAMPPHAKREPESAWAPDFWQWVKKNYGTTIVDTGETMPKWAEVARALADEVLYVLPQDLLALQRLAVSLPRGGAGFGVVISGYTPNVSKLLEPASLADMLGLDLIAAIPHNPRFANWQITNGVPWFPSQAGADPVLAGEMEKLVPRAFRENPEPARKRRWPF